VEAKKKIHQFARNGLTSGLMR